MTRSLPSIEPCPPPGTRDPICLAEVKARWNADNASADSEYDDSTRIADIAQAADEARFNNLSRPSGWSDSRWERRKLRIRQMIDQMDSLRRQEAEDIRDLEYLDADAAYVKDAEECPCHGNA